MEDTTIPGGTVMEEKLNPFYFPSSIIFIDDDPDFLKSFTMLLDEDLPVHTFTSVEKALDFINKQVSILDSLQDFTDYTVLDNADQKICLNIDSLHKQIYNNERFSQVSVVITDYAMPEMDGVQLLKGIKHAEIKRILLTGVADEKIAVQAFNEGYIDKFFLKSAADLAKEINESIQDLQKSFFGLLGNPIHNALSEYTSNFLGDSYFQELFLKLRNEHKWVEYYILEQPQGILLLNSDGEASFLFISSAEERRSHYEYAAAEDAPSDLLKVMAEDKYISWFPTVDGYYEAESCAENWKDYLYPINFFNESENTYHCALVKPSPLQHVDLAGIVSYKSYIEQLDKNNV